MVQAGRVACIFTPFALSVASLVCIVLVFLAGTSEKNNTLGGLYFFKADLSNFANATSSNLLDIIDATTTSSSLATRATATSDSSLESLLAQAQSELKVKDYYTIYLWNYCAWNGNDKYSYCSPKQSEFWFNPIEVWGLNGTGVESLLPTDLKDSLKTYEAVSKAMFIVYVAALIASVISLLIGITAMFSRWGSFCTTIFAWIAFFLNLAASLIATILFATLSTVFNKELKKYNITSSLGQPMLRTTWVGVLFSALAAFFWFFTICCCSGHRHSPYKGRGEKGRRVKVEKTPYTYERVGSPYLGPQGQNNQQHVPLTNMGPNRQSAYMGPAPRQGAYEPFRPQ